MDNGVSNYFRAFMSHAWISPTTSYSIVLYAPLYMFTSSRPPKIFSPTFLSFSLEFIYYSVLRSNIALFASFSSTHYSKNRPLDYFKKEDCPVHFWLIKIEDQLAVLNKWPITMYILTDKLLPNIKSELHYIRL